MRLSLPPSNLRNGGKPKGGHTTQTLLDAEKKKKAQNKLKKPGPTEGGSGLVIAHWKVGLLNLAFNFTNAES